MPCCLSHHPHVLNSHSLKHHLYYKVPWCRFILWIWIIQNTFGMLTLTVGSGRRAWLTDRCSSCCCFGVATLKVCLSVGVFDCRGSRCCSSSSKKKKHQASEERLCRPWPSQYCLLLLLPFLFLLFLLLLFLLVYIYFYFVFRLMWILYSFCCSFYWLF